LPCNRSFKFISNLLLRFSPQRANGWAHPPHGFGVRAFATELTAMRVEQLKSREVSQVGWSGSRGALLPPGPLKTALATITARGSSPAKRPFHRTDTMLKTVPGPVNFRPPGHAGSRQQLRGCSLFYEFLFRHYHRLSRDTGPGGSLPAFAWGDVAQRLNPYPAHYRPAFAFSTILCPQSYRSTLQLAFPRLSSHRARFEYSVVRGRTTGLPRSARVPARVRSPLYAGGAPSAIDDA